MWANNNDVVFTLGVMITFEVSYFTFFFVKRACGTRAGRAQNVMDSLDQKFNGYCIICSTGNDDIGEFLGLEAKFVESWLYESSILVKNLGNVPTSVFQVPTN